MATLNEKLKLALSSKNAVKSALVSKGVDMEDVEFADYAGKIKNLPAGGTFAPVTAFTGTKVFTSLEDASELNYYSVIGALLSYKEGVGFTAWNGEANLADRAWNPKTIAYTGGTSDFCGAIWANSWDGVTPGIPATGVSEYGEVIAVCTSAGLWVVPSWAGATTTKAWAASGSDMYNDQCPEAIANFDGANICHHFYTAGSDVHDLTNSIFADLKDLKPTGVTDIRCFLPCKYELIEIFDSIATVKDEEHSGETVTVKQYTNQISNLLKIATGGYWSCSQIPYTYYNAYFLSCGSFLDYYYKTNTYRSLACLRFGEALAS